MSNNSEPKNEPTLFHDVYSAHKQEQKQIIQSGITDHLQYNSEVNSAIQDFMGIAEAWKDEAIKTESEMVEDFKRHLEEYTANILRITTAQQANDNFSYNSNQIDEAPVKPNHK
jgi:hypothetical protein